MTIECEHGQLARACNICEYEREIAELKEEIATLRLYKESTQGIESEREREISGLKVMIKNREEESNGWCKVAGERQREIAKMRAESEKYYKRSCAWQSNYEEQGRTLSRLTALIESDEVAKQAVGKWSEEVNRSWYLGKTDSVRVYRKILKEEIEK
jgi:chromosome segregation ATPase